MVTVRQTFCIFNLISSPKILTDFQQRNHHPKPLAIIRKMISELKNTLRIIIILISVNLNAQKIEKIESQLIGKWNFINMIDSTGTIIKEKKFKLSPEMKMMGLNGIEIIKRPDLLLQENGEYINYWSEKKSESGFWEFDENFSVILLKMRISPNDPHIKSLKKYRAISKKSNDGFYYQKPIKREIHFMKNDSLVINESVGYYLVYKREK